MTVQRCPRCQRDLPQDAYHPDKWGHAGHYCRACMTEYKRAWRRRRGIGVRRYRLCAWPGCTERTASKKAKYCARHRPDPPEPTSLVYRTVHARVNRARGKASANPCAHCDGQADEWAYDHEDDHAVTAAHHRSGRVVAFSLDPTHYVALCKSCHGKFDHGRLPPMPPTSG